MAPETSTLPRSEYAAMKREARANEAAQREQAESQMRSQGLDPVTGQSSSATGSNARATSRPFFVPSGVHGAVTGSAGGTVAGAMLGALAFFTGRAFIQGGWSGVRAFYAAKFLNRTSSNPNPVPVSTTATTTPTLPVNTASGGSSAPSSPTTSSGSAQGGGTPVGQRLRQMAAT